MGSRRSSTSGRGQRRGDGRSAVVQVGLAIIAQANAARQTRRSESLSERKGPESTPGTRRFPPEMHIVPCLTSQPSRPRPSQDLIRLPCAASTNSRDLVKSCSSRTQTAQSGSYQPFNGYHTYDQTWSTPLTFRRDQLQIQSLPLSAGRQRHECIWSCRISFP